MEGGKLLNFSKALGPHLYSLESGHASSSNIVPGIRCHNKHKREAQYGPWREKSGKISIIV